MVVFRCTWLAPRQGHVMLFRFCSIVTRETTGIIVDSVSSTIAEGSLFIVIVIVIEGTHTDVLQHLVDLYPQGIRVADRDGMLPLHVACEHAHRAPNAIRLLVEKDLFAIVQNSRHGTPYQMVCSWQNTNLLVHHNLDYPT